MKISFPGLIFVQYKSINIIIIIIIIILVPLVSWSKSDFPYMLESFFITDPLSPKSEQNLFSPSISIHNKEEMLQESINWSADRKCFDLQANSVD